MAGRVAVVTGGGSGVGAATARALAADGWSVVIAGRRQEALDDVARSAPTTVTGVATDVTDERQVAALFDAAVERFGRVDLLFNNAGRGAPPADPGELDLDTWNAVVAVNLTAAFLCTAAAFRVMKAQDPQGGRIINNGSISAHAPRPRSIAYTATKHAITGLTKSTALDGRPYDITAGQIDIGNAATDMGSGVLNGAEQPDGSVRPEPVMDPEDVARAVVLMAGLPLGTNVLELTVMATKMPFIGRG